MKQNRPREAIREGLLLECGDSPPLFGLSSHILIGLQRLKIMSS